jgi:hypothetical protein
LILTDWPAPADAGEIFERLARAMPSLQRMSVPEQARDLRPLACMHLVDIEIRVAPRSGAEAPLPDIDACVGQNIRATDETDAAFVTMSCGGSWSRVMIRRHGPEGFRCSEPLPGLLYDLRGEAVRRLTQCMAACGYLERPDHLASCLVECLDESCTTLDLRCLSRLPEHEQLAAQCALQTTAAWSLRVLQECAQASGAPAGIRRLVMGTWPLPLPSVNAALPTLRSMSVSASSARNGLLLNVSPQLSEIEVRVQENRISRRPDVFVVVAPEGPVVRATGEGGAPVVGTGGKAALVRPMIVRHGPTGTRHTEDLPGVIAFSKEVLEADYDPDGEEEDELNGYMQAFAELGLPDAAELRKARYDVANALYTASISNNEKTRDAKGTVIVCQDIVEHLYRISVEQHRQRELAAASHERRDQDAGHAVKRRRVEPSVPHRCAVPELSIRSSMTIEGLSAIPDADAEDDLGSCSRGESSKILHPPSKLGVLLAEQLGKMSPGEVRRVHIEAPCTSSGESHSLYIQLTAGLGEDGRPIYEIIFFDPNATLVFKRLHVVDPMHVRDIGMNAFLEDEVVQDYFPEGPFCFTPMPYSLAPIDSDFFSVEDSMRNIERLLTGRVSAPPVALEQNLRKLLVTERGSRLNLVARLKTLGLELHGAQRSCLQRLRPLCPAVLSPQELNEISKAWGVEVADRKDSALAPAERAPGAAIAGPPALVEVGSTAQAAAPAGCPQPDFNGRPVTVLMNGRPELPQDCIDADLTGGPVNGGGVLCYARKMIPALHNAQYLLPRDHKESLGGSRIVYRIPAHMLARRPRQPEAVAGERS